jgi:hypothetical protein
LTRDRGSEDAATVQMARRYRAEAVCLLVATIRNERAPASARSAAAAKLLELGGVPTEPIRVADLGALDEDELEDLFVALLSHYGVALKSFAREVRLLHRTVEAQLELKRMKERQRPLPHRTSSKSAPPSPGPAETPSAPASDAGNPEYALPGPRPRTQATSERAPDAAPAPPPLVAGPGERIVDMPHRLSVDLGDRVALLRSGRQVVPLDVAQHPIVKKFVKEEPHAA